MAQASLISGVLPVCCAQHIMSTTSSTFVRYLDLDGLRTMCGLEGGTLGQMSSFFQRDSQRRQELVSAYVVPESIRCVQCGICSYNCPLGIESVLSGSDCVGTDGASTRRGRGMGTAKLSGVSAPLSAAIAEASPLLESVRISTEIGGSRRQVGSPSPQSACTGSTRTKSAANNAATVKARINFMAGPSLKEEIPTSTRELYSLP